MKQETKTIQEMAAEILQKRAETAEREKARILKDRRELLIQFYRKNPTFCEIMEKSGIDVEIRRNEVDQKEVWLSYGSRSMRLCFLNADPYRPEQEMSLDALIKAEHMILFINDNLIKNL